MKQNNESKDEKKRIRAEEIKKLKKLGDPKLDPYEINFLPEHEQGRGSREAFINEFDVIIGDHEYESPHSPLQNWSLDTDPSVMAGDQWVHKYKDIGFQSEENREYFEEGIPPSGRFFHPDKDVAYPLIMKKTDEGDGVENDS